MKTMPSCLAAYSHRDESIVEVICQRLWRGTLLEIDAIPVDSAGCRSKDLLTEARARKATLILFISNALVETQWFRKITRLAELQHLVESGVTLRPVLVNGATLPPSLAGLQVLNGDEIKRGICNSSYMQFFDVLLPGYRLTGALPHLYRQFQSLCERLQDASVSDGPVLLDELESVVQSTQFLLLDIETRSRLQKSKDRQFFQRIGTSPPLPMGICQKEMKFFHELLTTYIPNLKHQLDCLSALVNRYRELPKKMIFGNELDALRDLKQDLINLLTVEAPHQESQSSLDPELSKSLAASPDASDDLQLEPGILMFYSFIRGPLMKISMAVQLTSVKDIPHEEIQRLHRENLEDLAARFRDWLRCGFYEPDPRIENLILSLNNDNENHQD